MNTTLAVLFAKSDDLQMHQAALLIMTYIHHHKGVLVNISNSILKIKNGDRIETELFEKAATIATNYFNSNFKQHVYENY